MPTIFEDDFNSYNDGDLNGQGGWSGHTNPQVQGIEVYEGAKAIKVENPSTAGEITKSGTGLATGKIGIYFKASADVQYGVYFAIRQGTTLIDVIYSSGDGHLHMRTVDLGAYSLNTWHRIEIEWDANTNRCRGRIDDGPWSAWETAYNSFTQADTVRIYVNNVTFTTYYDYISESAYTPPVGKSRGYIF